MTVIQSRLNVSPFNCPKGIVNLEDSAVEDVCEGCQEQDKIYDYGKIIRYSCRLADYYSELKDREELLARLAAKHEAKRKALS